MYKYLVFLLFLLIYSINNIYGNDSINERRDEFISQGFGFQYSDEDVENLYIFLFNHGNPINISNEEIDNIWDNIKNIDITLEYEAIIVMFYKWNVRGTNEYRELLHSIKSKNGIEYLYGIKHGMTIAELESIIGKIEFMGDNAFIRLQNQTMHGVTIFFYKNKIEEIIWYYSLQ